MFQEYDEGIVRLSEAKLLIREEILAGLCADKVVLDLGCSGDSIPSFAHSVISTFAKETWGADRGAWVDIEDNEKFITIDLEQSSWDLIPDRPWDIIICSEIIEHMRNPGDFLDNLRRFDCDIFVSTPNPCALNYFFPFTKGMEIGNYYHLCQFTPRQFMNLADLYGFNVRYGGFCSTFGAGRPSDNPWLQTGTYYVIRKRDAYRTRR
jgi:2-polyprenyl-3-methyl-5-hydroxy-6-metoxy-1,4-benzoquinol methylase